MASVNTLSFAPAANDWLVKSSHPRILHVFDSACNLINERGNILSIVTPQIGNGPFSLVIADDICFSDHLQLDSIVSNSSTQLTLGNLQILTAGAKIWSPCPDWELLHSKRDQLLTHEVELLITTYLEQSGFNHRDLSINQSLVSNLSLPLVIADISSARKLASQLAGLGPGLTPSGDDFLMGAIYAVWIIHPPEVARVLARELSKTAAPLTTSLSAAWLRSAGHGEAGNLWHRFFDALVSSDATQIRDAIKQILAVGATSGADAMAGFLDTFGSWMEKVNP